MKANRWDDHLTRQARDEKWLARSVYKLQEIDNKYKLIGKGDRLLDLGCYPGSWSQYGIKKVGLEGDVVGIDLKRPNRLFYPNFRFLEHDILTLDIEWLSREVSPRDVVVSDLAPQTTGIRGTDAIRSVSLARRALDIALVLLKKKGNFVCKIFEGEDLEAFRSELSTHFRNTQTFRPRATRKRSREIYLVGLTKVAMRRI
jgi:23S rRNA (uridine2552-2'-O)-methyltransferase